MRPSFRPLAALFCATLLLAACGDAAKERAIEDAIKEETGGKADVKVKDDVVKVTTSEGTVTIGGQQLPADWPTDVPVYPGSTVQFSGANLGRESAAMFSTFDASTKVIAYYKAQLAESGWKIDATLDMGPSTVITALKEKRRLSMQIAQNEAGTSITIGFGAD